MRIKTNPSWTDDEVKKFRDSIKTNDGYCPCRLTHTSDTKCMCKEFREQDSGLCHCGLYYKEQ